MLSVVTWLWVKETPKWTFTLRWCWTEAGTSGPFGGRHEKSWNHVLQTHSSLSRPLHSLSEETLKGIQPDHLFHAGSHSPAVHQEVLVLTPPVPKESLLPRTAHLQRFQHENVLPESLIKSALCGFQIIGSSWVHSYRLYPPALQIPLPSQTVQSPVSAFQMKVFLQQMQILWNHILPALSFRFRYFREIYLNEGISELINLSISYLPNMPNNIRLIILLKVTSYEQNWGNIKIHYCQPVNP